jgi:hypothetical protein
MTDISLPRSARPTGRSAAIHTVAVRQVLNAPPEDRDPIELGKPRGGALAPAKREFAPGFVDFLLGRSARHW